MSSSEEAIGCVHPSSSVNARFLCFHPKNKIRINPDLIPLALPLQPITYMILPWRRLPCPIIRGGILSREDEDDKLPPSSQPESYIPNSHIYVELVHCFDPNNSRIPINSRLYYRLAYYRPHIEIYY